MGPFKRKLPIQHALDDVAQASFSLPATLR